MMVIKTLHMKVINGNESSLCDEHRSKIVFKRIRQNKHTKNDDRVISGM